MDAPSDRADATVLAYAVPPRRFCVGVWLTVIVTVAIGLRLGAAWLRPLTDASMGTLPDQREYRAIAYAMTFGPAARSFDDKANDYVYAFRMPLYPAFVAGCLYRYYFLDFYRVQIAQAVLEGTTVLAAALTGLRLGGRTIGLTAGCLVAVHPYLIAFSTLLLSETLFAAMLAWGLYGLTSRRGAVRFGGAAVLLMAVYARPSAAGLAAIASAWACYGWLGRLGNFAPDVVAEATPVARASGRFKATRLIAAATLGFALLVLTLSPWAIRNQNTIGTRVWLTTNDGYTAYDSFNPDADGSSNQATFRKWLATRPALTEVERSDLLKRMAWRYAVEHPARVVTLAFAKLGRFWSPMPLSADFGGRWPYVLVGGAYCVPLFVFAAVGVWRGGLGRRATLVLLLPALYFSAVHCVFVGSLRYRVPCDVPLAVLAAAGVVSLLPDRLKGGAASAALSGGRHGAAEAAPPHRSERA